MIVNIFYPDRGEIRVFGHQVQDGGRSGEIGYLPEERGLYRRMEVHALLEFHGELRGGRNVSREVTEWLERLGLGHCAKRRVETLSKGMSQKVQFIAACVPQPRLLILDEPFTGLDPVSADAIGDALLEFRKRGVTIILSTHDMNVAERMCDHIVMIYRGNKVLDGTLESIQDQYAADTVRVSAPGAANILQGFAGAEKMRDHGQVVELRLERGTDPQEVLRALVGRTKVTSFAIEKPSLHDIFVRIAGPESAEAQHA
jgi:ABC-2 type transport system ATP-binding protein